MKKITLLILFPILTYGQTPSPTATIPPANKASLTITISGPEVPGILYYGGNGLWQMLPYPATGSHVLMATGNVLSWGNLPSNGTPGATGPVGATGPAGPQGPIGPTGQNGAAAVGPGLPTTAAPFSLLANIPTVTGGTNWAAVPYQFNQGSVMYQSCTTPFTLLYYPIPYTGTYTFTGFINGLTMPAGASVTVNYSYTDNTGTVQTGAFPVVSTTGMTNFAPVTATAQGGPTLQVWVTTIGNPIFDSGFTPLLTALAPAQ